jgi:hypothetical protein
LKLELKLKLKLKLKQARSSGANERAKSKKKREGRSSSSRQFHLLVGRGGSDDASVSGCSIFPEPGGGRGGGLASYATLL